MYVISDVVNGFLQGLGRVGSAIVRVGTNHQTTSLIDVTRASNVEPLTIVSKDSATVDYLPDIMQGLLNTFIGYYLQAVALIARVDNIQVVRMLDKLNPNRDFSDILLFESITNKVGVAGESFEFSLPMGSESLSQETHKTLIRFAMEKAIYDATVIEGTDNPDEYEMREGTYAAHRDTQSTLSENVNLSVGKLINVMLHINEQELTVPVNFRLSSTIANFEVIKNIFTYRKEDNTFIERFHAWRSGRIAMIKDLILCQDLIDASRKTMMNDREGIFSEVIKRANNGKKYGLLAGNPSLATASNMFVITEEEARQIGQELGGKFNSKLTLRKIFDNTYAMIVVVIDRDWDMVTFYHRGISAVTTVSVKDIKAGNKRNSSTEILEMFKSYNLGNAPSF